MDICGNASPIMLDKGAQIRSSKCGSPSSSSSDSESSSSGLCLMVFICICFFHYRHSYVKKVLLLFRIRHCKLSENMDISSHPFSFGSCVGSTFLYKLNSGYELQICKELKVEEQTC